MCPAGGRCRRQSHCCCLSFRQDLKETFIDSGVMTAIKEWISPLPDKSLPALRIREELLRILMEVSAHLRGLDGRGGACSGSHCVFGLRSCPA